MQITHQLPIQGKHMLIIGNWGHKNLGDELILLGTITLLRQQNPKAKIWIQTQHIDWLKDFLGKQISLDHIAFLHDLPKGIRSTIRYWRQGLWNELWKYIRIDTVIIGGGEILTEENPSSYRYWLISLLPCLVRKLFLKTRIYLMGGIQIPQKPLNAVLFSLLLRFTTRVFARDQETVDRLHSYGYQQAEFFMDTAYFATNRKQYHGDNTIKKPYIIVNCNRNGRQFLDQILQDVRKYQEQGYDIFFVPMGKGKGREYDDLQYYNKHAMQILDWEKNLNTFFEKVAGAKLVITTRLHLFLIAKFLGVSTQVYPYQKKIEKMASTLQTFKIEK